MTAQQQSIASITAYMALAFSALQSAELGCFLLERGPARHVLCARRWFIFPDSMHRCAVDRAAAVLMGLLMLRIFASAWALTCILGPGSSLSAVAFAILFIVQVVYMVCFPAIISGADQAHVIVLIALFALAAVPTRLMASVAIAYLATQLAVVYFSAGLFKSFGSTWRSGEAISSILQTRLFGDSRLAPYAIRYPWATRSLTHLTMLWECLFPLVFLLPWPWPLVWIVPGLCFHVVTALLMRLNHFPIVFFSFYPSLLYFVSSGFRDLAQWPH